MEREVRALLDEIGHKMALPAVRTLAVGLRAVFRKVLQGVFVNREGVETVRHTAVLFSSELDPVHSHVCQLCGIPALSFLAPQGCARMAGGTASLSPLLPGLHPCHLPHV